MRKYSLKYLIIFVMLGSLVHSVVQAQGTSSSVVFNQNTNSSLYGKFGPVNDQTLYPSINSKWNQPRTGGTNPHQGTDFALSAGKYFTLPYAGFVEWSNSLSDKDASFVIMLDVNNNGLMDDSVWLRVWHTKLDRNGGIKDKTLYPKGTKIAKVEPYTSFQCLHHG